MFATHCVGLFPGQGSIAENAGEPWRHSESWSVVGDVSDASGVDVAELLLDCPTDELVRTDRAQLATFALSLVGWHDYVRSHAAPMYLAGHSLGEFSALVAGGVIDLDIGAHLVGVRGAAMQRAVQSTPGSMVALMGPSDGAITNLASVPDIFVANFNGPGQVVVSGTPEALTKLVERSKELGWRRATPLAVGGAFHSPLMASAQADLDAALSQVTFHSTEHVIGANVDGRWRHGGEEWRTLLSQQLSSPVNFYEEINSMETSINETIEFPPGSILTGLSKRIRDAASTLLWEKPSEMNS